MKILLATTLLLAFTARACPSDHPNESGDAGVFDSSSLPACVTTGGVPIDWGTFDAGIVGSGYCPAAYAGDCVATSPTSVVHLCHCVPNDAQPSPNLFCE